MMNADATNTAMPPVSGTARQPQPVTFRFRGRAPGWVFLVLYACSLAVLAWRINERPAFPYNWESYTIRGLLDYLQRSDLSVLRLNEGLMTDSGRSWVVVWPAWLGVEVLGHNWAGLRLPIVAIAACAPPLTWVFGRTLYSDVVGLTGAALVATSQVFLLYGRTATNVGLSLVPALLGFICLWMSVRPNQTRPGFWLGMLQVGLIVNSFFYSPLRFLWLIALVLFAVEWALRRGERVRFATAFAITLVILPIAIMLLQPGPIAGPEAAIKRYYYGRGEQIFRINDDRENYLPYFSPRTEEERAEIAEATDDELAVRLIRRNAGDLLDLFLDRGTEPAITDYWNPHGRLLPGVLVPFLLIGLALLLWRFVREPRARLLLALCFGFSLPLVLTSQVHIGRLIYVVPVVALICALPLEYAARFISDHGSDRFAGQVRTWGVAAAGALMVLLALVPTLRDWQTAFRVPTSVFVAERIRELEAEYPGQHLAYVYGDLGGYEVEGLRVAELEMLLHGDLTFTDLLTGNERGEGKTSLAYGALLSRLADPETIPGYCTNLYLVEPNLVERFIAITEPVAQAECGRSLVFNELP